MDVFRGDKQYKLISLPVDALQPIPINDLSGIYCPTCDVIHKKFMRVAILLQQYLFTLKILKRC